MPSMSYCMFENTTLEMDQIIDKVADAESFADLNLSEYERPAFFLLMGQCAEFLAFARKMFDNEDPLDREEFNQTIRDIRFFTDIELS